MRFSLYEILLNTALCEISLHKITKWSNEIYLIDFEWLKSGETHKMSQYFSFKFEDRHESFLRDINSTYGFHSLLTCRLFDTTTHFKERRNRWRYNHEIKIYLFLKKLLLPRNISTWMNHSNKIRYGFVGTNTSKRKLFHSLCLNPVVQERAFRTSFW